MSAFKKFKHALFLVSVIYLPSAQAELLVSALSGYCKSEKITILQSTTISPPADFNLKELNSEAVKDLYKNNMSSSTMEFKCNGVVLKSEAEINAGFKNKPKGNVDIFTDEAWVGLREAYPGVTGILRLSQPGYSVHHKYSILYVASSCDSLCGYADFIQYKFINGAWVYDKKVFVSKS